jgi:hypothetical protein
MAKNLQEFVVEKVCHHLDQQNNEMKQLQDELKKSKEFLQAYIDATNMSSYPISHTKCHNFICESLCISDNRDSNIYLGCSVMNCCDRCSEMFCDLHLDAHKDDCVCEHEWQTCCACEEEDEWN